ncbi:MAG: PD-(D/E)XK nuclease family protein [Candidatus Competibacteraceae bacterium]|nr:PD-(D/E)XK nuclease family protein [Candidatus Competibacteraceae bacterium]
MYKQSRENLQEDFFGNIKFRFQTYKAAQSSLNRYLATEFNVFSYIDPDENKISDIMASLLDPNGRNKSNNNHGQSDIFLKLFIQWLELDKAGFSSSPESKARREQKASASVHPDRRMDILITLSNQTGICIENKPFAIDLKGQIYDYCVHMEETFKICHVLYLSRNGNLPSKDSMTDEKNVLQEDYVSKFLICRGYEDLEQWIELCVKSAEAEKIRWFLKDFASYIHNLTA